MWLGLLSFRCLSTSECRCRLGSGMCHLVMRGVWVRPRRRSRSQRGQRRCVRTFVRRGDEKEPAGELRRRR